MPKAQSNKDRETERAAPGDKLTGKAYERELKRLHAELVKLLHGGWRDLRVPFFVAATLDAIYQLITQRFIYPLELLFTATLSAVVPYVILRGPANRIAGRIIRRSRRRQAI
jgi:hypothetical protein